MRAGDILTAKELQELLKISKNTLLGLEKAEVIVPDFRMGNRKRYYMASILKSIKKLEG